MYNAIFANTLRLGSGAGIYNIHRARGGDPEILHGIRMYTY